MSAAEMPAGATPERAPDWHSIEWKNVWRAWFKSRLQLRVAGVDARRATPPDPRPPRWGLAGYCQLDPSHPAIVTCEGSDFEPCLARHGQETVSRKARAVEPACRFPAPHTERRGRSSGGPYSPALPALSAGAPNQPPMGARKPATLRRSDTAK